MNVNDNINNINGSTWRLVAVYGDIIDIEGAVLSNSEETDLVVKVIVDLVEWLTYAMFYETQIVRGVHTAAYLIHWNICLLIKCDFYLFL